ncbi:MAG TPA: glycosyltransferase [Sphingomonadaceae bacterium]
MAGSAALVSIVIPCWNAERFVLAAVMSALGQTYPNVEVVVVDDGSSDGSVDALAGVRERITLISTPNRGACAARNTGLENASGEYVKFLDADDFLLPEAIAEQVKSAAALGRREFTTGLAYNLWQHSGVIVPNFGQSPAGLRYSRLEDVALEVPLISCPLHRRDAIEGIGGFRELPTRQDFDFFIRLLLEGYRPHNDFVPVFVYRHYSTGARVSGRRSAEDFAVMAGMYREYLEQLKQPADEDERGLSRGLAKSAWITARNALRAGYADVAQSLFGLARAFDAESCMKGTRSYRLAAKLLGPYHAERIGQVARSFRSKEHG